MKYVALTLIIALGGCKTPHTFETVKVMVGDIICSERVNTTKHGSGSVSVGVDTGVLSTSTSMGVSWDALAEFFNPPNEEVIQERRCKDILDEAKKQAKMQTELLKQRLNAGDIKDTHFYSPDSTAKVIERDAADFILDAIKDLEAAMPKGQVIKPPVKKPISTVKPITTYKGVGTSKGIAELNQKIYDGNVRWAIDDGF